jgi:gamma-glutamyltranspeptidase/glutathione hydrolase
MAHQDQDSDRSSLAVSRSSVRGMGGAVAGKQSQAVDAGITILREGGNAIDAAVATAFAMGVAEPWMNGLGGGGFMVVWLAAGGQAITIEYPMVAPSGADPGMFPLAGTGIDTGLFGWPATVGNANSVGYAAIAVPGTVAGLAMAAERYGTMPLSRLIAPAIAIAEEGIAVTWHTTLTIARDFGNLRKFAATRDVFLDANGNPPTTLEQSNPARIRQPDLARTLQAIADEGPRAFYEGVIGRRIANHLAASGAPITHDDFARYTARETPSLAAGIAGHTLHTIGKGTGGTSLAQALTMIDLLDPSGSGHNTFTTLHGMAQCFRQAFADRFAYLADPDFVDVPVEALLDPDYCASRVERFAPDRLGATTPGDRERLGVSHDMPSSVPDYIRDGSTTHLGVIDEHGNAVSLTQTLLSGWGSRVVVPGTGVLMNNGMMWFDPEPGRPNSIAPGKRPLSNMAPALLSRDGEIVASIGSSGGRRIMNCNAQVITNVAAHGLPMGDALAAPRIDASTRALAVSARIDSAVREALTAAGHPVSVRDETLLTSDFASPVAIGRSPEGELEAAADAWYFPSTARAIP